MKTVATLARRLLAYALSFSLAYAGPLYADVTDIANYPITQPASSSLNPNLLLILDDSGSMARQYTPDIVHLENNCFDSRDGDNSMTTTRRTCEAGDPPSMSPDFNVQYYDPRVRYLPAVNYDGTQRMDMNSANTADWTKVPTDNVSSGSIDRARKNLHSGTNFDMGQSSVIEEYNLRDEFPDRVWCTSTGDTATNTAKCKVNNGYTYPNWQFGYGLTSGGSRKYVFGAPYYYRIIPTEYCTDARMTDCLPLCETGATPCIDSGNAPDNVVNGKSYSVPAPVRFCTGPGSSDCHAKRSSSRPYPKFLGNIVPATAGNAGKKAVGRIIIQNPQDDNREGRITSIRVTKPDGTVHNLISSTLVLPQGDNAYDWADDITSRIDSQSGGFDANSSGNTNTVTITAPTAGDDFNGATISVTTNITARSPASISFTFSGTAKDSSNPGVGTVTSLIINGIQFAPNDILCTHSDCNSSTTSTRNNRMARLVAENMVLPSGWSVSRNNAVVTITAPSTTGSEMNGIVASISTANTSASGSNGSKLAGGTTTGDMQFTTQPFAGGEDPIPGTEPERIDVGTFARTNIVPGQEYNRFPARTDCVTVEGKCTYEEEMTNFANWFAYYRTRMQMAKTAIGRAIALAALPENWRLGFKTINFSSSHYLAVNDFKNGVGAQKDLWYRRLYGADANGSTPLRSALSRAGRYFADVNPNSMGRTPVNSACQPNFAVLTSDGYWSSDSTADLSGSNVGDRDGDGVSNTLADVAHYYYNRDLLPVPVGSWAQVGFANQVPPAGIDTAPHQHMTTFTVGMGVSGTLLFHPNYLEPGNSLDYDAIVGTPGNPGNNKWPTPTTGQETTVDDMWHAAVNGKGRFFSAQNPVALAAGINEVLSSIALRVGAGAAAATSNLQPVAGDNFAFTAQYSTVEWSGDLKARTISLVDGTIASRELWSAAAQLDQRTHADRVIYTLDAADTDATAVVTVNGVDRTQNANRLRSFCRTNASLAFNPTCTDGGLLTQQEQDDYFDPLGGTNGALPHTGGWPSGDPRRTAATPSSLIRYLRGEASNEIQLGGTDATDLYRNRVHLLGDIVNAQPAYVKSSPFSYADPFYLEFRNSTNGTAGTRKGTVYVAANDGMLHAFETDPDGNPYYQSAGVSTLDVSSDDEFTGTLNTDPIVGEGAERWAYVPEILLPSLKQLAAQNYASDHRFFVDGSPQIGDVCFGHTNSTPCSSKNNWRTILVGGLNAGGRGYYALDITDPDNPQGLWELKGGSAALVGGSLKCLTDAEANSGAFSVDCNIGLTYGNPIIVKRPEDGRWVVLLTSGYNNVSPGDGKGYLYVVDAQSGRILRRMSTGAGESTTPNPSGLGRISAWVDTALVDNTARAVYGGDLMGNVWRFQLEDTAAVPRYSVTKLATVSDPSGVPQPITAKPELSEVAGKRVVFLGTGKFLGTSDKVDNQRQTIYAIKDDMAGAGDADPSNDTPQTDMTRLSPSGNITGFVRQELTEDTTSTRTVATTNPVNFLVDKGWFIDLPDGGSGGEAAERVSVDPIIQLGTLVIPSNVPSSETCVAGGFGWVNFLDIKTGGLIPTGVTGTPASTKISGSLIVGINIVKIGDQVKTIVTTADNQQLTQETPVTPTGVEGRRVTWRELFVE